MFDLSTFESSSFPVDRCNKPNMREPGLLDSDSRYLCLIVDRRFQHAARLEVLTPYVCPSLDDGTLLFGWARVHGDGWVDHKERSVHDDDEVVVAWTLLDGGVDPDFFRHFAQLHSKPVNKALSEIAC